MVDLKPYVQQIKIQENVFISSGISIHWQNSPQANPLPLGYYAELCQ